MSDVLKKKNHVTASLLPAVIDWGAFYYQHKENTLCSTVSLEELGMGSGWELQNRAPVYGLQRTKSGCQK